jgi:hypothetical protein
MYHHLLHKLYVPRSMRALQPVNVSSVLLPDVFTIYIEIYDVRWLPNGVQQLYYKQ